MSNRIIVLGAGMVGTSCALQLQRAGMDVTLVDASDKVTETSYGNAGMIATSSVLQLNNACLWRALPGYMLNRSAAVRYNLPYVVGNAAWFVQYLKQSTTSWDKYGIRSLSGLIGPSLVAHKQLMGQAGIRQRLAEKGWLKLYRNEASFVSGAYERRCLSQAGVDLVELDQQGIAELEPDMNPLFCKGIWVRDSASVDSPGAVTEAYRKLFQARGGMFYLDRIQSINRFEQGYQLQGSRGVLETPQLVIALGPWSNDLLTPLRLRLPLVYERGYHQHFQAVADKTLNRTIHDADAGYVMAPMEQGLRISSGVELTERDAPATPHQLTQVIPRAQQAFSLGTPVEVEPWLGSRPSMPDSLPLIGPSTRHEGLWFCTGHGHIGFSTGPVSGRWLATHIAGQPVAEARPFLPQRFDL
ncbi:MAG: FAD-binding oxidoreductase [Marinobacterium sp.]|nr:FAD-binding oxidoreductase [Marinobacterium sp.]